MGNKILKELGRALEAPAVAHVDAVPPDRLIPDAERARLTDVDALPPLPPLTPKKGHGGGSSHPVEKDVLHDDGTLGYMALDWRQPVNPERPDPADDDIDQPRGIAHQRLAR